MRKGWRTRVVEFVFADIHFNLKLPMSFLAEIPTVEPQVSTLCIEFPAFVMRLSTPPPFWIYDLSRSRFRFNDCSLRFTRSTLCSFQLIRYSRRCSVVTFLSWGISDFWPRRWKINQLYDCQTIASANSFSVRPWKTAIFNNYKRLFQIIIKPIFIFFCFTAAFLI